MAQDVVQASAEYSFNGALQNPRASTNFAIHGRLLTLRSFHGTKPNGSDFLGLTPDSPGRRLYAAGVTKQSDVWRQKRIASRSLHIASLSA